DGGTGAEGARLLRVAGVEKADRGAGGDGDLLAVGPDSDDRRAVVEGGTTDLLGSGDVMEHDLPEGAVHAGVDRLVVPADQARDTRRQGETDVLALEVQRVGLLAVVGAVDDGDAFAGLVGVGLEAAEVLAGGVEGDLRGRGPVEGPELLAG